MAKKKSSKSPKGKKRAADHPIAPNTERADARHEAGHAVAAVRYGFHVFSIDIIPQPVPGSGGMMGTAGADLGLPDVRTILGKGENSVFQILITMYAGFQAERKVNPKAVFESDHPHSDGAVAFRYAAAAICTPVVEGGVLKTKAEEVEKNKERIEALLKRAEGDAAEFVEEYELMIDGLTDLLLARRRLSRAEVLGFLTTDN